MKFHQNWWENNNKTSVPPPFLKHFEVPNFLAFLKWLKNNNKNNKKVAMAELTEMQCHHARAKSGWVLKIMLHDNLYLAQMASSRTHVKQVIKKKKKLEAAFKLCTPPV